MVSVLRSKMYRIHDGPKLENSSPQHPHDAAHGLMTTPLASKAPATADVFCIVKRSAIVNIVPSLMDSIHSSSLRLRRTLTTNGGCMSYDQQEELFKRYFATSMVCHSIRKRILGAGIMCPTIVKVFLSNFYKHYHDTPLMVSVCVAKCIESIADRSLKTLHRSTLMT
jgi:hypothetical protein